MGYLASAKGPIGKNIRNAMVYGSVVASFCCEGFGVARTSKVQRRDVEARYRELRKMVTF
jgi:hypothetical protein